MVAEPGIFSVRTWPVAEEPGGAIPLPNMAKTVVPGTRTRTASQPVMEKELANVLQLFEDPRSSMSAEARASASLRASSSKAPRGLGGKKIAKLEAAIEEERQARVSAEREAAELRIAVATLTERTARVDELHAMIERLK